MGRQIGFFMINEDETELIKIVIESGDIFIDDKGEKISPDEIKNDYLFWIVSPQSKIVMTDYGHVDDDRVEAIQFERSQIIDQQIVRPGRLWVQLRYYSSKGENYRIITKDKWLEKKYNVYKRWIIKNCTINKDKILRYYIGKETYRLYKEEGYRMMTGPKVEIEFE
jgi:hypothetical protein